MRVSVVIPTYNQCNLLHEAMGSVLAQDFNDLELIVVDDGSTDQTRQTVKAFADDRVRYRHQPNGGVSRARNAGLDLAGGQYVAWLDSDDLWPPDYLSTMVSRLDRESDYGVAYCPLVNVYPDGRRRNPTWYGQCPSGWVTRRLFQKPRVFPSCTVMRRDALAEMCFDESLRTCEDADMGLRLSCRTRFLFVPAVHVTRRVRRESLSQHVSCRQLDINKVRVLARFYRHLGGSQHVPRGLAMRVLSRAYGDAARQFYRYGAWSAAATLFRRAIACRRLSLAAWLGWAKAALKPAASDAMRDWQEPAPLAEHITRTSPSGRRAP